jgi:hypothetical protein
MKSATWHWTSRFLVVSIAALVVTGVAFGGKSAPGTLSASLGAKQVVPQKPKGNVAQASGAFSGTLSGTGTTRKLSWQIKYSKLDHPTLVIADIHYGKPGKFGPVIVRLCGPCKPGQHGVVKLKETWVPAISSGDAFITLITGKNPNGEIRGQINAK